MADEVVRETISVKLVRLEEKLDALCVSNDHSHNQLLDGQRYLAEQTNVMDNRVLELEKHGSQPIQVLVNRLTDVVDKLTDTVAGIAKRTDSLELSRVISCAEKKGALKVYKIATAVLATVLSVATIFWLVGVFLHIY